MSRVISTREGLQHTRIEGVGSYLPERVVMNDEIAPRIDSSDEWIQERTGIVSRHYAGEHETVVDMAEAAARKALAHAGRTGADIDAILIGNVTHPYQTPSAASLLAHRLGAVPAMTLDVSAACAGFCHALGVADSLVRSGAATRVLVVGVEKLSDFIDFDDRGSAFIFGDGAGAVIVGPSDTPAIGPTIWGSDGEKWDYISQEPNWIETRHAVETGTPLPNWPAIHMKGPSVFRWAVWQMAPVALKTLAAAGLTVDDLDVFIPHQANARIVDAMVKEMHLPERVTVARTIHDMGNTSAASVPLAMDRLVREGTIHSGQVALLIGFGAGLAYAAQVVVIP